MKTSVQSFIEPRNRRSKETHRQEASLDGKVIDLTFTDDPNRGFECLQDGKRYIPTCSRKTMLQYRPDTCSFRTRVFRTDGHIVHVSILSRLPRLAEQPLPGIGVRATKKVTTEPRVAVAA